VKTPGNHLEALRGDRAGQHSIRINEQHRVRFRWTKIKPWAEISAQLGRTA
jgi:proteic killer suppression protein